MQLVVDIGNSTVHVGLCARGRILRESRFVPTDRGEIGSFLDRFLKDFRAELEEIGVVSVAPPTLDRFLDWASTIGVPVRVVGRDLPIPLQNPYDRPETLGTDRLLDAYGVRRRFEGGWIVMNFGTAVTVDGVTETGEFVSGAILPGIWLSIQSLARGTARLPGIDRLEETTLPSRSTEQAILGGMILGLAGMVDRIAGELARSAGLPLRAIATGGDAARIAPHSEVIREVIPHLTLQGIHDLLQGDG